MSRTKPYITSSHPKTLILGIHAPYNRTNDIESYFHEFRSLVKTNQVQYDQEIYLKIREIDPTYFITKGKLEDLIEECDKNEIEEVIVSEPLTAQQERNLGDILRCRIFDRTKLILEIFEKSAHSAEGKTQVQIAMLQHRKSRLAGKGITMSQQSGMIGVKGPGETAKEKETRHIEQTILKLKRDLLVIEQSRETRRKKRLANKVPHICLVGYTNAGKSTLLNVLTKSNVLAEDKLFATLDTTTREFYLDGVKKGIISDTVGFIQLLPPNLIQAFKSTLSELQYADLLLHVVDVSDKNWPSQIQVVQEILDDLDVDKPMIYVFNKADKVNKSLELDIQLSQYQPRCMTVASEKQVSELLDLLRHWQSVEQVI